VAGGLGLLVACGPSGDRLYSDTTPPEVATMLAAAGVHDLRGPYRDALCRRLPPDGPACDEVLLRLPAEIPAPSAPPPAPMQQYRVAFVPGLFAECLEALVRPFSDVMDDLSRGGVAVHYLQASGRGSVAENAERLGRQLAALPDDPRPLIVFAHSKGLADLLELVVRSPEAAARLAAIVSVAGAARGSLLADRLNATFRSWLASFPLHGCEKGTGQEIDDLRREVRLDWWRRNRTAVSVPLFSLVATPEVDHISPALTTTYRELARIEPRNDGMLLWYDQIVPGSGLLGYVNADHWAIAMPLSKELSPVRFLFRDAVPRTLLVEAAIDVIDAIRAGVRQGGRSAEPRGQSRAWRRTKSSSTVIPSPGRSGTSSWPSTTANRSWTSWWSRGLAPSEYSRMNPALWLAASATPAAKAGAPDHRCGASRRL
jgi:hypothetical protein